MKAITQIDMFGRKECSSCRRLLPFSGFVKDPRKTLGITSDCKGCRRERSAKWRDQNRDRIRELNHRPESKAARYAWWEANKDEAKRKRRQRAKTREGRAKNAQRAREYRKRSRQYRVKSNLRGRINAALNERRRTASVEKLIGCSIPEFIAHLESLWQPGMSWDNYGLLPGSWHIDHIKPCASFDLTDPSQQRECFHYENCRPLWAAENLSKGAKLEGG